MSVTWLQLHKNEIGRIKEEELDASDDLENNLSRLFHVYAEVLLSLKNANKTFSNNTEFVEGLLAKSNLSMLNENMTKLQDAILVMQATAAKYHDNLIACHKQYQERQNNESDQQAVQEERQDTPQGETTD